MYKENLKKLWIRSIVITISVCVVIFLLNWLGVFNKIENMLYDSRMKKTVNSVRPSEEIVVVLLDQASLDWANETFGWSWPWPRSAYGDIVRFFDKANAASVSFDVIFTEPSIYGIQDDEDFALACREYGRVVHALYVDSQNGNQMEWQEGFPLPPFFDSQEKTFGNIPFLFPIECIGKSAKIFGSVSGTSDSDEVIRRAASYKKHGNYYIPSLGTAPLYVAGNEMPDFRTEPEEGRLLRFQKSLDSYVPYNAAQILQSYYSVKKGEKPLLEPELFENMYVFFGFYAPGLFDICATPISSVYPGVGVHITQLDNTLQNSFLIPTNFAINILLIIVSALFGAFPISYAEIFRSKRFNIYVAINCSIVFGLLIILFAYLFFAHGIVIPMTAPFFSLGFSFVVAIIVSYRYEGKERRYLKSAFRQYLSPVVIEDLISHPERLSLGGVRRRISMYFSDIQGFTSISERLNPEELTSLLNLYLSAMTDVILESGGTIDKYEGDAILAFWNAPLEQENHAKIALEAAIKCHEKLDEIQNELQKRAGIPFKMRIGLNTGDAIVGNMGSRSRFDYTMLGDAVNLAARLEGLNKQFGTYCMCASSSKEDAEKAETYLKFRELGRVNVVGKKETITVFEPMSSKVYNSKKDILAIFNNALQNFYSGNFEKAKELFATIQDKDAPAFHYVIKCQELIDSNVNIDSWDGVWMAKNK